MPIITQIIEPHRRSFFDVLRDNLKVAEKNTYVHRIIYIAEHTYGENGRTTMTEKIEKIINNVNGSYCDEPLTGIFLYYPSYFCHLIEGSEDTLLKHLKLLLQNEMIAKHLGKTKILIVSHHINQRFVDSWISITAKPPSLLEKFDKNADLQTVSRQVWYCIQKIYKLAETIAFKLKSISESSTASAQVREKSYEELQDLTQQEAEERQEVIKKSKSDILAKTAFMPDCLPEYGLFHLLLHTVHTQELQKYVDMYEVVPDLEIYEDNVWPVPCEFVPMNVFDEHHDPVTDLPQGAVGTNTQLE